MIAIIDYGMGNLRSVQKALEYQGCGRITDKKQDLSTLHTSYCPAWGRSRTPSTA